MKPEIEELLGKWVDKMLALGKFSLDMSEQQFVKAMKAQGTCGGSFYDGFVDNNCCCDFTLSKRSDGKMISEDFKWNQVWKIIQEENGDKQLKFF